MKSIAGSVKKGREGGKNPNPFKIRITLAASCSHLKRTADNEQHNDDNRKPCPREPSLVLTPTFVSI